MLLPTADELAIVGVADPNVANRERVVIRPTERVSLMEFFLCLGVRNPQGMVVPIPDTGFWFNDIQISPPAWVIVYTGPGVHQVTAAPDTGEAQYIFHWGRASTVFVSPEMVPVLFRLGGILIGHGRPAPEPIALPRKE